LSFHYLEDVKLTTKEIIITEAHEEEKELLQKFSKLLKNIFAFKDPFKILA
jgi:hypothetical protein